MVEPMIKNNSVINITERPPPTAYKVPEAQPPPSCMPMPNKKAPTIKLTPTGETLPVASAPKNVVPIARIGANKEQATASMTIWARIAWPLPTEARRRKADVKPKRAWNNVYPSPKPMTRSSGWTISCVKAKNSVNAAATTRPPMTSRFCGRFKAGALFCWMSRCGCDDAITDNKITF